MGCTFPVVKSVIARLLNDRGDYSPPDHRGVHLHNADKVVKDGISRMVEYIDHSGPWFLWSGTIFAICSRAPFFGKYALDFDPIGLIEALAVVRDKIA